MTPGHSLSRNVFYGTDEIWTSQSMEFKLFYDTTLIQTPPSPLKSCYNEGAAHISYIVNDWLVLSIGTTYISLYN